MGKLKILLITVITLYLVGSGATVAQETFRLAQINENPPVHETKKSGPTYDTQKGSSPAPDGWSLTNEILFHPCKPLIKSHDAFTLQQLADAITKSQKAYWLVDGHSCNQICGGTKPGKPTNCRLSWERAAKIRDLLVNNYNVPPGKLVIRGFADALPAKGVDPSDPKQRRAWVHPTYPPQEQTDAGFQCPKPNDIN